MGMKESSDELTTQMASTVVAPARLKFIDYAALAFSTWGVGFIPFAPGTWGSLVGVWIFLLLRSGLTRFVLAYSMSHRVSALQIEAFNTTVVLGVVLLVTLAGIRAATRAERLFKRKDPGSVVVDEVAGQLVTFMFLPLGVDVETWILILGFLLFRAFDIWKPYPARRLESLESGLGVMADDIVAGAYSAAALSAIIFAKSLI